MPPPRKSPHVPYQYYGYSLQCTHCLYMLLDAVPGSKVSVEVLEDVACEDPTGEVEAVQLKSAAKTNPIGNRSLDLWKTLGNWLKAVEIRELSIENTTFHLRLGRKRGGTICESFANALNPEAAEDALSKAKDEFFTPKTGTMRKNVPEDLRKIVEVLFDPEQHNRLKDIIIRFKLSFGTQYAYEELLNHLKTKFIDEAIAEDVLLHALGWVKKGIDNAVERDEPPIIDVDEFRAEISSFRTRLIGRSYLPSFAGPPSFEEVELHRLRTFVRQLDLIEVSEDRILACIADFLSARTNRAEYASRGYVHRESLREFERTLASLWENHRDEIELNVNEDAITRGKKLAFRCLRETARLEGIDVPADFVRGCFHALADIPSIGWHPRYEALLSNPEGE